MSTSQASAGDSPILDQERLSALLQGTGFRVKVLAETDSTMLDLSSGIVSGELGPSDAVAALHQRAARGRLERVWSAPSNSSLLFSVCLDLGPLPGLEAGSAQEEKQAQALARTPLVVGLAVVRALDALAARADAACADTADGQAPSWGTGASLKWPNDVHLRGRKAAGILCQMVPVKGRALVIAGVGLNVNLTHQQLPTAASTSLWCEAADLSPAANEQIPAVEGEPILARILIELEDLMRQNTSADAAAAADLMQALEGAVSTLGQRVRAEMHPTRTGEDCVGTAVGLDPDGALVLEMDTGERVSISSGDVWHLRPASSPRTSPATGRGELGLDVSEASASGQEAPGKRP